METFHIHLSPETIEVGKSSVFSEFYVCVGNKYFPYENWGDLSSSCLDWWLSSIYDLCKGNKGAEGELVFVDGPYSILIKRLENTHVKLTFYRGEEETDQAICDFNKIIHETVRVAGLLVIRLHSDKIQNDIITALEHGIKLLKQYL